MKNTYIQLAITLLLTVFIVSCETEIKFNGKETAPSMVINSILNPDSAIKVHITKSKFFLDLDGPFDPITNATVQLYVNDKLIETLNATGNGYYTGTYKPFPGDIIKIIARNNEFDNVHCSTEIPVTANITSVDTTSTTTKTSPLIYSGSYNDEGYLNTDTVGTISEKKIKFTINIADRANYKNFYRLKVKHRSYYDNGTYSEHNTYFNSEDLVFGSTSETELFEEENTNYYHEFNDNLFDGKTYGLTFSISTFQYNYFPGKEPKDDPWSPTTIKQEILINIESISPSYYYYLNSRAKNNEYIEIFSEPVQIYNNIVNGIGILGAYNTSITKVRVPLSYTLYSYGGY
ncbi:MAG: DUF4249 domain-containing protein [Paludibacter sp.]|nr:DUF4249 domain-containing protein [Paludibacter sp.]